MATVALITAQYKEVRHIQIYQIGRRVDQSSL